MFREMRRKRQALVPEECTAMLERGTSGVLAVMGDNGYPYAVPLSYVYHDGKIYFHSAKEGHKIDGIRKNANASFCVIDRDQVMPKAYTTYFRSVIVFGQIRILEEEEEIEKAIRALAHKYYPDDCADSRNRAIQGAWNAFCIIELTTEHISGKQARELAE